MSSKIDRRPTVTLPADQRRCACCGFDVPSLVEVAHVPNWRTNPEKFLPLCLLCHRAYDVGLISEDEIEGIRSDWLQMLPNRYTIAELSALWKSRQANWSKLQQGAGKKAGLTKRRQTAARKAAATRARKDAD